jgi:hypothetical protein
MTVQSSDAAAVVPIEDSETKVLTVKLEIYRAPHRDLSGPREGGNWLKCSGKRPCPLYCDGTIDVKRVRRSLYRHCSPRSKPSPRLTT